MSKQSFSPNITVKLHNIKTPGLQDAHQSFIVRQLIVERVRSIMDGFVFADSINPLIEKFMTYPEYLKTDEAKEAYLKQETQEVIKSFNAYELNPTYHEDLMTLVALKGLPWRLISAFYSGVIISVDVK